MIAYVEEKGWDIDFYVGCVYNRTRTVDEWKQVLNGEALEMSQEMAAGRLSETEMEQAYQTAFESLKPTNGVFVGIFPRIKDEITENVERLRRVLNLGLKTMRKNHSIPRRTFLGAGLAAAGGAAISCGRGGARSPFRFFTAEEGATVDAICEALIPGDQHPGGHQAGVVNYIDIQLTRHFKKYQRSYRHGIAAVDTASRARFGKRFTDAVPGERVAVLATVEANSKEFFDLILAHTRQGFYGDPRHGGNRHMASWKMVGLPYPPVRGRMHYEEWPR